MATGINWKKKQISVNKILMTHFKLTNTLLMQVKLNPGWKKEPLAGNADYGKDEDAIEALLKKHDALMSDLEAFGNTIKDLKEKAAACRQQETPVIEIIG